MRGLECLTAINVNITDGHVLRGVVYILYCTSFSGEFVSSIYKDGASRYFQNVHTSILNYMASYSWKTQFLGCVYSSPNIVRVIKSRRMRWTGHVARMGEERGCIGSWWGNRRERDHWGDLGVDGWIILGIISRRWDVGIWTGLG